ncbi:hypothetical protein CC78DRAFT_536209 [Lojkania enalia]|uniref:Bacteriophage T5 Orf172 DNA-binding domain-containing protein n=1 Tax=Lojkania enalia TaxID=147567 RepID=A0A9P4K237_9PLEO|nr:hypothetical protein CC78DRAFT_536209 [Didymosphaeria enalia]
MDPRSLHTTSGMKRTSPRRSLPNTPPDVPYTSRISRTPEMDSGSQKIKTTASRTVLGPEYLPCSISQQSDTILLRPDLGIRGENEIIDLTEDSPKKDTSRIGASPDEPKHSETRTRRQPISTPTRKSKRSSKDLPVTPEVVDLTTLDLPVLAKDNAHERPRVRETQSNQGRRQPKPATEDQLQSDQGAIREDDLSLSSPETSPSRLACIPPLNQMPNGQDTSSRCKYTAVNIDDNIASKLHERLVLDRSTDKYGDQKLGLVYIFKTPDGLDCSDGSDGLNLLKIGYTSGPTTTRQRRLRKCTNGLSLVHRTRLMLNARWAETLVKCELANLCRPFECGNCKKSNGKPTVHAEWFEVDRGLAIKTVERWRNFILQEPYEDSGFLKKEWRERLNNMEPAAINEDPLDHDSRWKRWSFVDATPSTNSPTTSNPSTNQSSESIPNISLPANPLISTEPNASANATTAMHTPSEDSLSDPSIIPLPSKEMPVIETLMKHPFYCLLFLFVLQNYYVCYILIAVFSILCIRQFLTKWS